MLCWIETLAIDYREHGLLMYHVSPDAINSRLAANISEAVHDSLSLKLVNLLAAEREVWLVERCVSCSRDMKDLVSKGDEFVDADSLNMRKVH